MTARMTARMTAEPAAVAALLAARGLVPVPLWPVGPDGWCSCGWVWCTGRQIPRRAWKHPRYSSTPGPGGSYRRYPPPSWWERHPDDPAGIDRAGSRIVTVEDDGELAQWARAEAIPLPRTFTMASPAGNLRFAYRVPGAIPPRNRIAPGGWAVDVMGRHVAPGPGVRNLGGEYRLVLDAPVAAAPAALCSWLADPRNCSPLPLYL